MKPRVSIVVYFGLSLLFLTGMLCLPAPVIYAGTLADDFNDGNADGWTVLDKPASKWVVKGGGYSGEIAEGAEGVALIGKADWDVESIEVKIRDLKGEWMALAWRWKDVSNFDSWWIDIKNKKLEAWPKIGDYEGAARASHAIPLDVTKEATLKIVIKGDTHDAYFDGKLIGNYKNDKFKTGQVGLLVWAGSATFDDVKITGPNVVGTGGGPVSVSPKGNLATFWGKMKR
jgi:hypothetical protein